MACKWEASQFLRAPLKEPWNPRLQADCARWQCRRTRRGQSATDMATLPALLGRLSLPTSLEGNAQTLHIPGTSCCA